MKLTILGSGTSVPHATRAAAAHWLETPGGAVLLDVSVDAARSPRKVVLTHLYPEWDGVDLESEARALWSGETIAAFDGLRLEI